MNPRLVYLYLFTAISAWGSMYVVSKFVLAAVPSFTVLFIRYLLAGAALLLLLGRSKHPPIEKKDYKYIFLVGFLGYFLSTGAQLLGTSLTDASLAALINSLNPIFIMLFAVPVLHEKLTLYKGISVLTSLAGVYIIIGGAGEGGRLIGSLVSLFSVVTWSLTSVALRQVMQKYNPLLITAYGMLVAIVCSLPVALLELSNAPQARQALFDPAIIGGLIYIGLICTALAHFLWNKSLSIIEAGSCALFYPLQPLTAAFLGFLFLDEKLTFAFFSGGGLIVSGILFSVLAPVYLHRSQHASS
ncbi:MAG: DMT family transporter [Sporomusaceae bacterium]|nr:DMT family transporter [Sporomusaceae bacterium]